MWGTTIDVLMILLVFDGSKSFLSDLESGLDSS